MKLGKFSKIPARGDIYLYIQYAKLPTGASTLHRSAGSCGYRGLQLGLDSTGTGLTVFHWGQVASIWDQSSVLELKISVTLSWPRALSSTFKLVAVRSTPLSFVSGPMPKATKVPIFFPIVAQNTTRDWKSFDALTWKTERSWRQILIQFAFCYNLLIYTFLWMGFDSLLLKIVTKFMVEQISYFVTKHGDLLPKRATYNFLQTKSWLLLLVSWPQLFITFSSHFSITSYFAGAGAGVWV